MKKEVPIWEKSNLTLEETAAYSGIGVNKLRELTDIKDCDFVLWVGTTCDSVLLVYNEAIICLALFFAKSERA